MMDIDKTVFISYRRSTSKQSAHSIFTHLREQGYDVFLDVVSIDNGPFDTVILNQIAARTHFVVLLSRGALNRCVNPNDWLRREIEEAMRLQRNIVPIIEEGFDFENEMKHLPSEWREDFKRHNAIRLFYDYFEPAMEILRTRFLTQSSTSIPITPTPSAEVTQVEQIIQYAELFADEPQPRNAQEFFDRAIAKKLNGDLEGVIDDCTEAIRLNPSYSEAFNTRGLAYGAKGNLDSEILDYNKAISLKPDFAEPYCNRSVALRAKGQNEKAIEDCDKALYFKPDYAEAYFHRGQARKNSEDLEGAIADYTEAIRINPNYTDAYNNRGIARKKYGDLDGAIADYTEAIRLDLQRAGLYKNRAMAYKERNDIAEAINDYEKYLELGGKDDDVKKSIMKLKHKLKR